MNTLEIKNTLLLQKFSADVMSANIARQFNIKRSAVFLFLFEFKYFYALYQILIQSQIFSFEFKYFFIHSENFIRIQIFLLEFQ